MAVLFFFKQPVIEYLNLSKGYIGWVLFIYWKIIGDSALFSK